MSVDASGGFAITYLLIASGVIASFTWWLTIRYARPGTGPWVLISTFFSWYLVFVSFYVLLPVDLLQHFQSFYYGLWQFIYWVSFSLTWIALPVQQYYEITGEFTRKDRFIASLKFNAKFYAIACIIFIGLLIFIAVENGLGWMDIVGVVVCIANTWGLFLGVVSLGYGLVEVARSSLQLQLHPIHMFVYLSLYVVFVCARMDVRMYVCVCGCAYVCLSVFFVVFMYARMDVRTYVCVCMCVYVCVCVCVFARMFFLSTHLIYPAVWFVYCPPSVYRSHRFLSLCRSI